uniref:Myotubularin phosphatase domain-containing protein n=1 Tax=Clytia hemisphaerica TaxID=252671 RepID=A0A7M5UQV2_9CNID
MAARNLAFNDRIEENAVQVFLGESVLAKANVNRLNIMGSRNSGARGTLFVTNFKVAFTSNCGGGYDFKKPSSLDKLLSEEVDDKDDIIPLTVIEHLFAISTSKQKRKKIKDASKELSSNYDIIEIVTKDFRIIQYDFKLTSEESRKPLIKMLSHYSFPTALSRLFAFDYGKKAWQPNTNLTERAFCTYSHAKDYELDLNRLGASEQWRVSKVNVEYRLCKSLPQYNVCPASLDDESIIVAASKYPNNRFPVWLWSDSSTGAALLLSSQLKNDTSLTMHEHPVTITESIRNKGHTTGETISIDIGSPCPTLKQLKSSFKKLKRECIFRSSKDFWESDSSWLGDIEQTGWLSHVSSCLELVHDIIKKINEKQTSVIVCDPDGRHFAILITSLVQILLDPYYRSLMGLQALIQKDWVMKGFPFCQRLHHISESSKSTIGSQIRTASFKGKDERRDKDLTYEGESPVFVLFLECLHQLIRQHPLEFEYTEQFLVCFMMHRILVCLVLFYSTALMN